jgi:short subunit dehydrogenase-like uncharacterized protein
MIYGATGYTGVLLAESAKAQGLTPVLAGRNRDKVAALGNRLGLPSVAVGLEETGRLKDAVSQVRAVLHAAGPFSATAGPMLEACLQTGRHYVDITGEIAVFEHCAKLNQDARSAGITLMPGAGFDVVPSDCLAAYVHSRLPDATRLHIAISGMGRASRGTARTMLESLGSGTMVRRGGKLVALKDPPRAAFDFGAGPVLCVGVSWGDVATAYRSTGIPDIDVYFAAEGPAKRMLSAGRWTRWVLGQPWLKPLLKAWVDRMPEGPSPAERLAARHVLVARAENRRGQSVTARLVTPEGYTLTSRTALDAVARVAAGGVKPGFQTPSLAFGPDYILGFEDCVRSGGEPAAA